MKALTRAQKKWLKVLKNEGFVAAGGWGHGQRNRPLEALVVAGFAEFGWGPKDSALKVQGYLLK